MVRSAIADEYLLTYLNNIAREGSCVVGLILGQVISYESINMI